MKDEWKDVATKLEKALRRTSHYECNHLDHSGGFYHKYDEPCPIQLQIEEAFESYEELIKTENA